MPLTRHALLLAALLLGVGAACAPRTATTTWAYSSWTKKYGGGSLGAFKKTRGECQEQEGIADPKAVEPNSEEETRFLRCMNAAGWCTYSFKCEKRGT